MCIVFAVVPLGQLPLTARMSLMGLTQSAVVDLQESLAFNEPFYVVVVEKENDGETKKNESFGYLDNRNRQQQPSDGGEGNEFHILTS